ncbi:hypothetical protein SEPCBS119000_002738 [Sporothrix epigloea]|uniref:Ubiquitin-like domain-containing protein n=1 Tax=Sporothrix epigloea TaxID=1892477 RepID=A0ABP0DL46_9PEZI
MASPGAGRPPKPLQSTLGAAASDRNSKLSALLESIDAELGFTKKASVPVSEDYGVNSFRRAKFLFPKLLEEQRKAAEAEKEAAAARKAKATASARTDVLGNKGDAQRRENEDAKLKSSSPSPPPPSPARHSAHGPKRRKVSRETPTSDNTPSPTSYTSPGATGLQTEDTRHTADAIDSHPFASSPPSPKVQADKGKQVATEHPVHARAVFPRGSSDPKQRRTSPIARENFVQTGRKADDSVVLIDSDSDGDSDPDLAAYRSRGVNYPHKVEGNSDNDSDNTVQADDDSEIIDTEFAEYIMRARNKAKARKADMDGTGDPSIATAGTTTSASQDSTARTAPPESSFALSGDKPSTPATASQSTPAAPQAPTPSQRLPGDQQYRIFITSHFPQEVPPLLAHIRMDQMMRYAKEAYIVHAKRNGVVLPENQAQSVLLTWKGSKIYNFTTGQSLGIQPDANGRVRGSQGMNGSGDLGASAGFSSGGLHLEIWTEQLYEAYLQEEDKRRLRNLGELVEDDPLSDDETGPGVAATGATQAAAGDQPAAAGQSTRIRLVLTSRDHEKLKITAHSDTTAELLASVFRQQRKIAPDKTVVIMWDGDELEKSITVGEAEIEDMDSVEVHIR